MTSIALGRAGTDRVPRKGLAGYGRLLHSEWTKIRSVRSTFWSLAVLTVTAIGLNTLIVGLAIANWNTTSAATKHMYAADPTGFLRAALQYAEIPLCVLGVLVITAEYSTGMIRSSILAVPRRVPMLAAKAAVFGAVASRGGASGVGYLLKDRVTDVGEFIDALARVAAGGAALDPEVVAQLFGASRRADGLATLTPREGEVLKLMAEGRSNRAIAARYAISERVVQKHVGNIFSELGLPPSDADHRRVLAVLRYLEG
jgi:DNA-binding CsgD family transcriptional regulator